MCDFETVLRSRMISVRYEVLSIHLLGLPTFVLYENEIISYSSCLMFSGNEDGIPILFSLVWGGKNRNLWMISMLKS